jgi:aldose 1-epimerase
MAPDIIEISDAGAKVRVVPALGAGLVSYDLKTEAGFLPIFRRLDDLKNMRPFDLAMNLLVPWSNRISGGGFNHRGRFYPLEANVPGEPYPIHGNAFTSPWKVELHQPAKAELSLFSEGPGPFRYRASVTYALEDGRLDVSLSVENLASSELPYGIGLHPWFSRSGCVLLRARSPRVVLEDDRHLPAGERILDTEDEWNFEKGRALPRRWINNAFLDWDGRATIDWADRGISVDIDAAAPLKTFIVYSPGADADHFCFEPVSHTVDAHNIDLSAKENGLIELSTGDHLAIRCRFSPRVRRRRSELTPAEEFAENYVRLARIVDMGHTA